MGGKKDLQKLLTNIVIKIFKPSYFKSFIWKFDWYTLSCYIILNYFLKNVQELLEME